MSDQYQARVVAGNDGAVGLQDAPVKKPKRPDQKPKQLPPYRVLLHNDEVNSFEHVIKTILTLTTLTAEDAFERALEAHETGVALLLVTHRERAELYVDQFLTCKLTTTMEPAE